MIAALVVSIAAQNCGGVPTAGCSANASLYTLVVPGSKNRYLPLENWRMPPNSLVGIEGTFSLNDISNAESCCAVLTWQMQVTWPLDVVCTDGWAGYYEWCDPPLHALCVQSSYGWPESGMLAVTFEHEAECGGGAGVHGYPYMIDESLPPMSPGDFTIDGSVDVDDLIWTLDYWWLNGVDGLVEVIMHWSNP